MVATTDLTEKTEEIEDAPLTLVIYVRVSTAEQAKGHSLETQLKICRAWAIARKYVVANVYIESGWSARTDKRPAFQQMIKNVIDGEAQAILVQDSSRFIRNVRKYLSYRVELDEQSIKLLSATEPHYNGDSPSDWLTATISAVINEFESKTTSSRIKRVQMAKAVAGYWPGPTPLGYIRVGEASKSRLEICPDHGPMLQQAFADFSTGRYQLTRWTKEAEKRGYKNRGTKISRALWGTIFRNIFYIGKFEWSGKMYENAKHPNLIDLQTWQKVQDLLDSRRTGGSKNRRNWLLRGLLWSEVHARQMSGSMTKKGYGYYMAKGRSKRQASHTIRADDAEAQLEDILHTIYTSTVPSAAPDKWLLAFLAAPNLGAIYSHLPTTEEKRNLLRLVFVKNGLHVDEKGKLKPFLLKKPFLILQKEDKLVK